jgi:hypothetical protein
MPLLSITPPPPRKTISARIAIMVIQDPIRLTAQENPRIIKFRLRNILVNAAIRDTSLFPVPLCQTMPGGLHTVPVTCPSSLAIGDKTGQCFGGTGRIAALRHSRPAGLLCLFLERLCFQLGFDHHRVDIHFQFLSFTKYSSIYYNI